MAQSMKNKKVVEDQEIVVNIRDLIKQRNHQYSSWSAWRIDSLVPGTGDDFYVCTKCRQTFETKERKTLFVITSKEYRKDKGYCRTCFQELIEEKIKKEEDLGAIVSLLKKCFSLRMRRLDESWYQFDLYNKDVVHRFSIDICRKLKDLRPIFIEELNKLFHLTFEDMDPGIIEDLRQKELRRIREEQEEEKEKQRRERTRVVIWLGTIIAFILLVLLIDPSVR